MPEYGLILSKSGWNQSNFSSLTPLPNFIGCDTGVSRTCGADDSFNSIVVNTWHFLNILSFHGLFKSSASISNGKASSETLIPAPAAAKGVSPSDRRWCLFSKDKLVCVLVLSLQIKGSRVAAEGRINQWLIHLNMQVNCSV
jgi:hypothetical protein